jgi:imidazolonepropionase
MNSIIKLNRRGFAKTIKLTNIGRLVGFNGKDEFYNDTKQEIILQGKQILEFGKNLSEKADKVVDLEGAMVTPSFIDPHTHIFPPKDRSNEFSMRVNKSYQEIAEAGGGIISSVKACRNATFDQLMEVNERNLKRFIAHGTTVLEMKSGYGLNLETEILLLQVINALKNKYAKQIEIIPTFLGAHAFPPEYKDRPNEYVDLICTQMIPEVKKQKLAEYCDVFCENGYFDYDQSLKILKAAKAHKLKIRIHADEF